MSQNITPEEIVALAKLSKLVLTPDEIALYQKEVSAIIDYVAMLSEVNVKGLKPTYQVSGRVNVMRQDVVEKQIASPDALLAGAPQKKDGYIKVGRMI